MERKGARCHVIPIDTHIPDLFPSSFYLVSVCWSLEAKSVLPIPVEVPCFTCIYNHHSYRSAPSWVSGAGGRVFQIKRESCEVISKSAKLEIGACQREFS